MLLPLCFWVTSTISRINISAKTGCVVQMKILIIVPVFVSLTLVYGRDDNCDELGGECISLSNCDVLVELIKKPNQREILKKYICGFDGIYSRVCCPPPRWNKCFTLEGRLGTCVSINICSHLYAKSDSDRKEDIQYVQRSRCVGPARHSVCCNVTFDVNPPDPTPVRIPTGRQNMYSKKCSTSNLALGFVPLDEPSNNKTQCCGIEAAGGNKISGGTDTSLDKYPWLAILEYERPYSCGGTLISNLYVLTAAHCLVGNYRRSRGVYAVRLGEYNTTNEGKDCVEVAGGYKDCTDGDVTITINKVIVHPEFGQGDIMHANDIGLLRLSYSAPNSDFIRPICLPSLDVTKAALSSDLNLHAAGWGEARDSTFMSAVKLHVVLPLVDQKKCEKDYSAGKSLIWDKQICAGGVPNKDTCRGDSGGPLEYLDNESRIHQIIGITSFGTAQCGIHRSSVFTKVIEYVPWIIATIKDFTEIF